MEGEASQAKRKLKLEDIDDIRRWVFEIVEGPIFESPIDINVGQAFEIELPPLQWHNFHLVPKKMKLTNTGQTIILSGKWHQERPYLTGGPLVGNYVFSQLHLHWGANDMEGSEHAVDGIRHPMEMHAIFFKEEYETQEAALKQRDGVAILAYFYKLYHYPSASIAKFTGWLRPLRHPFSTITIEPTPLNVFLKEFNSDFLAYWGTITTSTCTHYILWLLCRMPRGVVSEQVEEFRMMHDEDEQPMERNFRDLQPLHNRPIFHVNPSASKYATLLQIPLDPAHKFYS